MTDREQLALIEKAFFEDPEIMCHIDSPEEIKSNLVGRGIELIYIEDEMLPAIFDNGTLLIVGYISTRGSLYAAGTWNGKRMYFKTNTGHNNDWIKINEICGQIARDMYKDIQKELKV